MNFKSSIRYGFVLFSLSMLFLCSTPGLTYGQYFRVDIKRDSARSDKITGGIIERAEFQAGEADIRLTINVPAFEMTFWQNGKQIKNYQIGVGLKEYPIYIGQRKISEVIWNPVWNAPDSEWVSPALRGKTVKPTDPLNPLGKIKIPLGYGYLLHEAKGRQDLGNLVSHGCVRVLRKDLYELSERIVAAYTLKVSAEDIVKAKRTRKTFVIELDQAMPIEITYDTIVIEDGYLRIYPDVYDFNKNTVENLKEELVSSGIDIENISDETFEKMLARAEGKKQYRVSVEQLYDGSYLEGKIIPVLENRN